MDLFHFFLTVIILFSQGIWENELNTAKDLDYLNETEKNIFWELNRARSNPGRYAEQHLVPMRTCYDENKLIFPGKPPIITSEGRKALDECIRVLKNTSPSEPIKPVKGLYLAAFAHVKDQSEYGGIGHFGSDGSKPIDRIERYGVWDICAAENISYGIEDARRIVISLLIDDGVPDRGHRKKHTKPCI